MTHAEALVSLHVSLHVLRPIHLATYVTWYLYVKVCNPFVLLQFKKVFVTYVAFLGSSGLIGLSTPGGLSRLRCTSFVLPCNVFKQNIVTGKGLATYLAHAPCVGAGSLVYQLDVIQ